MPNQIVDQHRPPAHPQTFAHELRQLRAGSDDARKGCNLPDRKLHRRNGKASASPTLTASMISVSGKMRLCPVQQGYIESRFRAAPVFAERSPELLPNRLLLPATRNVSSPSPAPRVPPSSAWWRPRRTSGSPGRYPASRFETSAGEQASESRISGASTRCIAGMSGNWLLKESGSSRCHEPRLTAGNRSGLKLRPVLLPATACYTGRCSSRSRRAVRRACRVRRCVRRAARRCGRRCARWKRGGR